MMFSSLSIKMPLYLVVTADDDLLRTRSSQSELTPLKKKQFKCKFLKYEKCYHLNFH